jgi:hypothetical protein
MVLDGMQPARIRTMDAVEGEVSARGESMLLPGAGNGL